VGAGNLGSALVGYPGLKEHRFNLVAVFDNNYGKIGRPLWDLEILDVVRVKEVNQKLRARIAILAVPASAAQNVADLLVDAGVHAILNFAPVLLRVPDYVVVRNVSFLQELAVLSYHLSADEILAETLPYAAEDESLQNGNGLRQRSEDSEAVLDAAESHASAENGS